MTVTHYLQHALLLYLKHWYPERFFQLACKGLARIESFKLFWKHHKYVRKYLQTRRPVGQTDSVTEGWKTSNYCRQDAERNFPSKFGFCNRWMLHSFGWGGSVERANTSKQHQGNFCKSPSSSSMPQFWKDWLPTNRRVHLPYPNFQSRAA